MIYGHGDDSFNYADIRLNFSSNVSPYGINYQLLAHLKKSAENLNAYPEPLANTLATRIENQNGFPLGTVLVTNGAVEAFYLLASLFEKKKSLIYVPSFSEYKDACEMYSHDVEFSDNECYTEDKSTHFDTIWICNPNNPDGKIFDAQMLIKRVVQNPRTVFIVDEAYVDFVDASISVVSRVPYLPNLVVVRSLTKRFAIPGLRLGYLVASPVIVNKLKEKLMPWRINTLAMEAGMFCLSDGYSDNFDLNSLLAESNRLQAEISRIDGFLVYPSKTSFFLVKSTNKSSLLKNELAEKYGILIRDASNFRGLSDKHFRISTQLYENNNYLIQALKAWR